MKASLKMQLIIICMLALLAACGVAGDQVIDKKEEKAPAVESSAEVEFPSTDTGREGDFKIVMLGDSLTAGFGLPQEQALPEQLESYLSKQEYVVEVINAGVSGDTSAGGLARYDWSVASLDPDLLILALGANDFLNGMDPAETENNLRSIIDRAQEQGLDILLVGVAARETSLQDSRAGAFNKIYPKLAVEYDLPIHEDLLKRVYDQPQFLQADGLHPNAEGVLEIAEDLSTNIVQILPAE